MSEREKLILSAYNGARELLSNIKLLRSGSTNFLEEDYLRLPEYQAGQIVERLKPMVDAIVPATVASSDGFDAKG